MTDDRARHISALALLRAALQRHWAARLPLLLEEAVADSSDAVADLQLLYPHERIGLAHTTLMGALLHRGDHR